MAKLELTEKEKEASSWSDLDNESLGALLRYSILGIENKAEQLERTYLLAASLMLCCNTAENNATEQRINCFGVTSHGKEHGDWLVTISKKVN